MRLGSHTIMEHIDIQVVGTTNSTARQPRRARVKLHRTWLKTHRWELVWMDLLKPIRGATLVNSGYTAHERQYA